jgi:hypothetical protein
LVQERKAFQLMLKKMRMMRMMRMNEKKQQQGRSVVLVK